MNHIPNGAPAADANRVTLEHIQSKVKHVSYAYNGTMTICFLKLENSFKVHGMSSCVDPATYNLATGEKYAYENALDKVWELEGYLLKERMHQADLK